MPCPSCQPIEPNPILFEPADVARLFSGIDPRANELTCPDCHVQWIVERSSDAEFVKLGRASALPIRFNGRWRFYESSPRGEGDAHETKLTLTRTGDRLDGSVEDASWNDYARDETLKTATYKVTGSIDGEVGLLNITGGQLWLDGGQAGSFAIKPVARFNWGNEEVLELFVGSHASNVRINCPFRTWSSDGD